MSPSCPRLLSFFHVEITGKSIAGNYPDLLISHIHVALVIL